MAKEFYGEVGLEAPTLRQAQGRLYARDHHKTKPAPMGPVEKTNCHE